MLRFIKADGIPIPISLFAILMGIGGTLIGVTALFDPTSAIEFVDGADKLGTSWAGRNLGLGIASLVAVALRNPAGYVVAFSGAIWREVSDLVAGMLDGGSLNVPFAIVLVLEIAIVAIAIRAVVNDRQPALA